MNQQPVISIRSLTQPPRIAWPTVILFVVLMVSLAVSDYLAIVGMTSLWTAALVNGVLTYFLFSVVHDSSHGAISQIKWLNESLGHIGIFFFGPFAPLNAARWIHMQHHRFTNDHSKDPDAFGHKMDIFMPLRWINFDYFYTKFFLEQSGPVRQKYIKRVIFQIVLVIAIVAASFYFGHGKQVLMLWLLPTRISSALFVLMFVYLPHAPFKATAGEDEYQASNIRAGWEWLLTPLMAYQNYHLVHHLYPSAPFYRMLKLWNAKLGEHLSHAPFFVATFGVGRSVPAPVSMTRGVSSK